MKIVETLKKWNEELEKGRKEAFGEFKVSKWVFLSYFFMCLILLVIVFIQTGSFKDQIYITCPIDDFCKNPFYNSSQSCSEEWCSWEKLPPHFSAGKPPTFFQKYTPAILLISFFVIFIVLAIMKNIQKTSEEKL